MEIVWTGVILLFLIVKGKTWLDSFGDIRPVSGEATHEFVASETRFPPIT